MKILVISDQAPVTQKLRALLHECSAVPPQVETATRMGDAIILLQQEGTAFDHIVLDIDTVGVGRMYGAALIRQLWPDVSLTVMSYADSDDDLERSIDLGVMGYLSKTSDARTLALAFRQILSGLFYLPAFFSEPSRVPSRIQ